MNNGADPEAAESPPLKAPIVVGAPAPEPAEEPAPESAQPAVEELAVEEPAIEQVEQPAVEKLAIEEPAIEEPAIEEPAVEELAPGEAPPYLEAPIVVDAAPAPEPAEEPAPEAAQPAIEEPAIEEPAVEQPTVEELAPGEAPPYLEAPIVVDAPAPEPAEEPAPEAAQPAIEEPAIEEPAIEEPAIEEPAVEQPAIEEPAAQEPAAAVQESAPEVSEPPEAPVNETLPVALEPELRRIIDTAVARVASIELEAIRESRRLTQRSEEEGREALKFALDRAFQLVNSFELLTVTVAGMVSALRVELDTAMAALQHVDDPYARMPRELDESTPVTDEVQPEPVPDDTQPEPIPDAGGLQGTNGDSPELLTEPSIEMTEMFREQIVNMKNSGKTKEEAERTLLRFNLGRRFIGLLDEIYAEDTPEVAAAPADGQRKRFARRFFSRH